MISRITSGIIVVILTCLTAFTSYAKEDEPQLIKMRATAYCLDGITASGEPVRRGICASGHKDWLGKTVVLYQRLPNDGIGQIIGIYEVKDTGCKETVIDIWQPTLDDCQEVMNRVYEDGCQGRIWCEVLDARG